MINSKTINRAAKFSLDKIEMTQTVFLLLLRLWLAKVFFMSGLTKIQSWDTTLMLFEYEYSVPLISPVLAAWMSTAAELAIPVLLVFGLLTRLNVVALFILNIVAAISYADISFAGEKDHMIWGLMMMVLFFYGPGKLALDRLLVKYVMK
ncbi:MAG: putative oxidoreductase [Oleispira sp.]|jgi:putative oxidoreductase